MFVLTVCDSSNTNFQPVQYWLLVDTMTFKSFSSFDTGQKLKVDQILGNMHQKCGTQSEQ